MKASYIKPFTVAFLVIIIDQLVKTWVRTHMLLGEEIHFFG